MSKDRSNYYLIQYRLESLGIEMQTHPLELITFPTLPHNFPMLMSELDWPAKALRNPNGSLFTKPMDIDTDAASDIGLQCFSDFNESLGESLQDNNKKIIVEQCYDLPKQLNSVIEMLFEDTTNQVGAEIDVDDNKEYNERITSLTTNIVNAITSYITESMNVVNPVVQLVAGSNAGAAMKKMKDTIATINQTNIEKIQIWLDNNNSLEGKQKESQANADLKANKKKMQFQSEASYVVSCMSVSTMPSGSKESKEKFVGNMYTAIKGIQDGDDLDSFISKYTEARDWDDFVRRMGLKNGSREIRPIKFLRTESINSNISKLKRLFESSEEDADDKSQQKLEMSYDDLYNSIYTTLADCMSEVIGPRADWACMKGLEESMKNLKDRADAEITKKIEIICKTNGQKSLKHWPFKAEGLLTMWNRYSSELQTRMKNRLTQLTGVGGRSTGSPEMVEGFLRHTYPSIIAAMVVYRLIFEEINILYKKGYIYKLPADMKADIIAVSDQEATIQIKEIITKHYIVFGDEDE